MRRTPWIWCVLFVAAAVSLVDAPNAAPRRSPKPERISPAPGPGTWEGAGSSGGFELTLEQPKDGPLTGKVVGDRRAGLQGHSQVDRVRR